MHRIISKLTVFTFAIFFAADQIVANEQGKQIYAAQCASCHGSKGEGVANVYDQELTGDLSIKELAEMIAESMPEDNPDQCVAKDAHAVAEYIYDAFYSRDAQRRINSARIELSHLTVRQHRESVADIINSFGQPIWIPDERGLVANYFAASHWKENKRLAKQIDTVIEFEHGAQHFRGDGKYEGIESDKDRQNKMGLGFSVYWNGGIIAPETGSYEFVVQSKNGFQLWINDIETPLIDRWVRSDDKLTHNANIRLIAGRVYSLRLNMFSYEEPFATIGLHWKPPHGVQTLIPAEVFVPHGSAEVAVLSTQFPPDDASRGFIRGASVSEGWDQATTSAALETAAWVAKRLWKLAGTTETAKDREDKVKKFCLKFVERAFVTKLNGEQRDYFVGQHFSDQISLVDSSKRVVILALKSPRFLYPQLQNRTEDFEQAREMALYFWDSVPDDQLFELASKGELTNASIRMEQAERMMDDPRSKQKLREFFHYLLKTDEALEASKDQKQFPDFDERILADLRISLDRFLEETVWNERSDFRELFLADYLYVNRRLAEYYSIKTKVDGFVKVNVDPTQRAGILTHPYLMSSLAYHKNSSPIHRGVFVARNLLGRSLKQPPQSVAPLSEQFDPNLTTRQRVEHQTSDKSCMACHSVINPLGFSLEHYDAVGRFRTVEKEQPIDVTAVYESPDGASVALSGARDLAKYLANNEMAQRSFVQRLFQQYVNQSIYAYGDEALDKLHKKFANNSFNIQQLIVDIAQVAIENKRESTSPEKNSKSFLK